MKKKKKNATIFKGSVPPETSGTTIDAQNFRRTQPNQYPEDTLRNDRLSQPTA